MDIFSAISDKTRRTILDKLRNGEMAVSELGRQIPISQSALSQHLAILRRADLVLSRRDGRRIYYRLNPRPIQDDQIQWLKDFTAIHLKTSDSMAEQMRAKRKRMRADARKLKPAQRMKRFIQLQQAAEKMLKKSGNMDEFIRRNHSKRRRSQTDGLPPHENL